MPEKWFTDANEAVADIEELRHGLNEANQSGTGAFYAQGPSITGDRVAGDSEREVRSEKNQAARELREKGICASVDILQTIPRETLYLTTARTGSYYSQFDIFTWTGWLGHLATQLRNHSGPLPTKVEYGPEPSPPLRALGPFTQYNGCDPAWPVISFAHPGSVVDVSPTDVEIDEPKEFGLSDIILTLDLAQNSQIRGPLQGAYVLTGGPGTGKTTVALHRIPYLVDTYADPHQQQYLPANSLPVSDASTLVVVWEPHLAPYLQRCLSHLGLRIPEKNVAVLDEWLAQQLRPYVVFGPDGYRKADDSQDVAKAKQLLDEEMLEEFLTDRPRLRSFLVEEFSDIAELFKQVISESAIAHPDLEFFADENGWVNMEKEDLTEAIRRPKVSPLRRLADELTRVGDNTFTGQLRHAARQVSGRRLVATFRGFLASDLVKRTITASLGAAAAESFDTEVKKSARANRLSPRDRLFLLWLVELSGYSAVLRDRHEGLDRYSHVMIDEAQYYDPLVLRLLGRLAQLPNGSMTIVGDLEQRIRPDGGLIAWESMGLQLRDDQVNRLTTNYRWAEELFGFLESYQRSTEKVELVRPSRWYSKGGKIPVLRTFSDVDDEVEAGVSAVLELRQDSTHDNWSVAVIVPEQYRDIATSSFIPALADYDVPVRWADDEDVKDCVHKVIVTTYDNIVGLQFDAVFVFGVNEILKSGSPQETNSVWVAISRPHKYLYVSRAGNDSVFSAEIFNRYRK